MSSIHSLSINEGHIFAIYSPRHHDFNHQSHFRRIEYGGRAYLDGHTWLFLSVLAAMILHGVAQTASNGSRIFLHRQHLRWHVFIPYTIGSMVTLSFFVWLTFVPNKAMIFIIIGSFPFLGLLIPRSINFDIEKKPIAFICGIIVTAVQLLAGASGPVLDIFYITSELDRFTQLAIS
ncbi:MAG: hypothetical protein ACI9CE_001038 [Flavobacterium sp.]